MFLTLNSVIKKVILVIASAIELTSTRFLFGWFSRTFFLSLVLLVDLAFFAFPLYDVAPHLSHSSSVEVR